MKLFKDLKKGATEASEKAKLMIEINKFKIQISQKQKEIDDEFKKIGKTIFELFKAGEIGELPDSIRESYNICLLKQEEIKELEKEIRKLKNEKHCPQCQNKVKPDIQFCPCCGYRFEEIEGHTNLESQKNLVKTTVKCSKCETENEKNAKFCCSCGKAIE
ncbi:zinc ribbon domain-containing protein [Paramaledivibacter caminithermalis]|jgi:cytochrome c-type biogenesis protein CcmH/NrfF|uniref:Double zinc ribbon n=1 Tax=Paramaledivibacter caminithermalis (strain DSM 15212 / CIP 107654 / DViRD3) TaxID=1121301 RepID=A0A1M6N1Q9_PARC5|nr:zinc ribbon domain-containing protein [Paramaledivibacter caminithermalis]SHJ89624.1 Double zinc ribbon [Paramaledivibacter caminithermalis DSM 15212]